MIVLLTDFGLDDIYVGVMKGVIAGIAPQCRVIDLTHEVHPQDITEAAYRLEAAYRYFPSGSTFCCVVDPGVGSSRRAIAVQAGHYTFVAPDNGLLTPVIHNEQAVMAVHLDRPEYFLKNISATFHGRDVFAPVAAHLAGGTPVSEVGSAVDVKTLVELDTLQPVVIPEGWRAKILSIDHFGNLITNCSAKLVRGRRCRIHVGTVCIERINRTYTDVSAGEPVAYIGSGGKLELALNGENAARIWKVRRGDEVLIEVPESSE
jgi:S-adenosylmethionine hydrolase